MKAAIRSGILGGIVSFTARQKQPTFSPSQNPDEILVKVKSAAINPIDYKLPKQLLGQIYGLDFSGVVQEVGSNVADLAVGDAVFGRAETGSLAEYCVAKADNVSRKSEAFNFAQAAAMPTAYVTAVNGLLDIADVQEGCSVLVIGASGGCGLAAIQLSKAMGCHTIVGICSSKNVELVKEAGATMVVDYTDRAALESFFRENHGKFDCVYDAATRSGHGEDYTAQSMGLLSTQGEKSQGEITSLPQKEGQYVQLNGAAGIWIRKLAGMDLPNKNQHLVVTKMSTSNLRIVSSLLEKIGAKPHLTQMPFTEKGVKDGFDLLKSRRARGKIVFDIS